MTWVIGSPTQFGYAIGAADVQVTWRNGEQRLDCLQKVYEVAPFISAGFSGSVRLGFDLLRDLTQFLSPNPGPGESWMPRWVALKWWRRARRIFRDAPAAQRKLGASLLLMGVRPTDNSGCLTGGRPDVIILSARHEFEPEFINLGEVGSIGSGNAVALYMDRLRAQQQDPFIFMQGEVGSPGGMGRAWMSSIARMLRENPQPGISQQVHFVGVWRDRVRIEPLDQVEFRSDGSEVKHTMPQVASGWQQFQAFADRVGLTAAEASA